MQDRTLVQVPGQPIAPGDATIAMPPGATAYGLQPDRTQQLAATPCPACTTPNGPGETFCQDCGLQFGSLDTSAPAPTSDADSPRLVETTGGGRECIVQVGVNSVGRDGTDILVVDGTVSRRHAAVHWDGKELLVEDLGSTNGTNVAGKRLQPGERVSARSGDTIRFGNILFQLTLPAAAAAAATSTPSAGPAAADRGEPVAFLTLENGSELPLFSGVNTIGRRGGCDLVLPDSYVSGRHAEVLCEDQSATFTDVGSTNGSFHEGVRLEHHSPLPLSEGTAVTMGKTAMTFRWATESAADGTEVSGSDAIVGEDAEPKVVEAEA